MVDVVLLEGDANSIHEVPECILISNVTLGKMFGSMASPVCDLILFVISVESLAYIWWILNLCPEAVVN